MTIANPKKYAREVCRQYGAKVIESNSHGSTYQFPDGSIVWVGNNEKASAVAGKLAAVQKRFGPIKGEQFDRLRSRPHKPSIDLEHLTASPHAKSRLALMQTQAGVTYAELVLALRTPRKVLWSDKHNSWMWVGERVSVAVREVYGGGHIITTVSWSTAELFEKYPRPKDDQ